MTTTPKSDNAADGGSSPVPCSPSDTPETDAEWKRLEGFDGKYYVQTSLTSLAVGMSHKCKELERKRDAALAVISAIEERYIDGCDTYEDWKFMGDTARSFLEENVKVEAPTPEVGSRMQERGKK